MQLSLVNVIVCVDLMRIHIMNWSYDIAESLNFDGRVSHESFVELH